MLFMRQFIFYSFAVLSAALVVLLAGCEGEKDDPTSAEKYFKNNPYSSEERTDPLPAELEISPAKAAISIVGQEIIFTASGGEGDYHWYLANEDNGELNSHGANQCSYKCKQAGNNTLTVQDESGHYASAQITPVTDTMTVMPSNPTLYLGSGERYVSFTVSGGTSPYVWTSGSASLGAISYSAATSYTAGYTAVASAYGQNTITVRDAEGRIATTTVTQRSDTR